MHLPLTTLLLFVSAAGAGGPGATVTGSVPLPAPAAGRIAVEKYAGSISGRVAAPPSAVAGVWIEGPGIKAPASPPDVNLAQEGYQFARSLLVVPRGTTVHFPNNDPDYHNVFSLSRGARFDLGRYKRDATPAPKFTFSTAGLVRLQCEIHQHMRATVLVVDSPWCTVTDADGSFRLGNLPAGTWMLRVQADEKNQWHGPVTVSPGGTVTARLTPGPPPAAPGNQS